MMSKYLYLGIDQSLTNTGIVLLNESAKILLQKSITTEPKSFTSEIERLVFIRDRVASVVQNSSIDCAALEGFGYGARGNAIFQLAGIGYLIREIFHIQKIPLEIIAPSTLKKFVTGSGRGQKNLMLLHVFKRWGEEFSDDNICDAYCLARFIMEKYNA